MSNSARQMRPGEPESQLGVQLNVKHFQTCPGVLKMLQLLLGCVATGVMGYYVGNYAEIGKNFHSYFRPELFFVIVAAFALITTGCIVISMVLSVSTAALLPDTMFEVVYHLVVALLMCAASIALMAVLDERDSTFQRPRNLEAKVTASVVGLLNSLLYGCSFVMAVKTCRKH